MNRISWIFVTVIILAIALFMTKRMIHRESGTIILLAGTSSSGKSTLAQAIKQKLGSSYEIVAVDDLMNNIEILADPENPNTDVDIAKVMGILYPKIKELSAHKNIIVDMVFGLNGNANDGSYEKFFNVLHDRRIISVLVYCPLDVIMQHTKKRNSSGKTDEKRDAMSPFVQFSANYKIKAAENEVIVDTINRERIKEALKEAMRYDMHVAIEQGNIPQKQQEEIEDNLIISVDTFFHEKFVEQLGWLPDFGPEVKITSRHHYDLIINSGTGTPEINAQHIIDYL